MDGCTDGKREARDSVREREEVSSQNKHFVSHLLLQISIRQFLLENKKRSIQPLPQIQTFNHALQFRGFSLTQGSGKISKFGRISKGISARLDAELDNLVPDDGIDARNFLEDIKDFRG